MELQLSDGHDLTTGTSAKNSHCSTHTEVQVLVRVRVMGGACAPVELYV